jgi:G:T-mismatch repair DNA endonuclease (very short patch repair protein)
MESVTRFITHRAALHACVREILGGRRRVDKNVRRLPGQPDILIPNLWLAIFADGCFYQSCPRHGAFAQVEQELLDPKIKEEQKPRQDKPAGAP